MTTVMKTPVDRSPTDVSPKVWGGAVAAALVGVVASVLAGDFQWEPFAAAFASGFVGYLKRDAIKYLVD